MDAEGRTSLERVQGYGHRNQVWEQEALKPSPDAVRCILRKVFLRRCRRRLMVVVEKHPARCIELG